MSCFLASRWSQLPTPSENILVIRVRPNIEPLLRKGYPWVYAGNIRKQSQEGKAGDRVVLFDEKNRFLAFGLYDPFSPIRVRILQLHSGNLDASWFSERLQRALEKRSPLLSQNTNGYRILNGENDGFPGCILDRYDTTYVLKLYTSAWYPYLLLLLEQIQTHLAPVRLVLRLSRNIQHPSITPSFLKEGLLFWGEPYTEPLHFLENGLSFEVDPIAGQKTGFFLDQRENRARVEGLAEGKEVLNVFAYSGGFSVYAARGSARSVVSLDISRPALASAQRNFALNQHIPTVAKCVHSMLAGDAFEELPRLSQKFDLVIIDPPFLAKQKKEMESALNAYRHLASLGLKALRPEGIFVMASCSRQISETLFFSTLEEVAQQQKRVLLEIARTSHALDHPVTFTEGAYLKCLFAKVSP